MAMFQRDTNPESNPKATPATLDDIMQVVQAMIAANKTGDNSSSDLSLQLLREMKESINRTVPKSSIESRNLSVFNIKPGCTYCDQGIKHEDTGDYGHPKPELRYESYQCSVRMRADALEIVEVELLNALGDKLESSGRTVIEAHGGKWTATIDRKGTAPRLIIDYPATDLLVALGEVPALKLILIELLHGTSAVNPLNMLDEIRLLKAELDKLKERAA